MSANYQPRLAMGKFKTVLMSVTVISSFIISGCGGGTPPFTSEESDLINDMSSGVVMYVLDVTDPAQETFLRQEAREVPSDAAGTDGFETLCRRMTATVQAPRYDGVGIAAPQVGISRRMIAVQRFDKAGNPFEIYVNPVITRYGEQTSDCTEGCLSIPGRSEIVTRPSSITISYNDPGTFEEKTEAIEGFTAVIFQHEIDHLDGILYTDRARPRDVQPGSPGI